MKVDLRERNASNFPVDKQAYLAERTIPKCSAAWEIAQELVGCVEVLNVNMSARIGLFVRIY